MNAIIEKDCKVTAFDFRGMTVFGASLASSSWTDEAVEDRFFEVCYQDRWHGCHSGSELIAAGALKSDLETVVKACAKA